MMGETPVEAILKAVEHLSDAEREALIRSLTAQRKARAPKRLPPIVLGPVRTQAVIETEVEWA